MNPNMKYEGLIDLVMREIHSKRHSMNSQTLLIMKTDVRTAMKEYLVDHRNPFEVDYQAKIDAVDLIFNVLKEHVKALNDLAKRMDLTTSGFDKLTRSKAVRERVRVGAVHRVTLKEFETGNWLIKELHLRRDGTVGGVSLWIE